MLLTYHSPEICYQNILLALRTCCFLVWNSWSGLCTRVCLTIAIQRVWSSEDVSVKLKEWDASQQLVMSSRCQDLLSPPSVPQFPQLLQPLLQDSPDWSLLFSSWRVGTLAYQETYGILFPITGVHSSWLVVIFVVLHLLLFWNFDLVICLWCRQNRQTSILGWVCAWSFLLLTP